MYLNMVDTLVFSIDFDDYVHQVDRELFDQLDVIKKSAYENQLNKLSDKTTINLNGMVFEVLGNGKQGYKYILHNEEYEVDIARHRSRNEDYYPMIVRIKSVTLWAYGPYSAYKRIIDWINKIFGTIKKIKISRMDLCCHTDKLNPGFDALDRFSGLYRKANMRRTNRKVSGLEFGSRNGLIYCRIYNKTQEITEKRNKYWFFEIWTNFKANIATVWNIEFELKRDFFNEYNIESVEDAFNRLNTIWRHCTEQWLVYVDLDHTRIENCSVNEAWIEIQKIFSESGFKPLIRREKQSQTEAEQLLPAIMGYLTSYAAKINTNEEKEAIQDFLEKGKKYLARKNTCFKTEADQKIFLQRGVKGGEYKWKS